MEKFSGEIQLEIKASEDDIQKYLDANISRLPDFVQHNWELRDEIKTEIIKSVDGMSVTSRILWDPC